MKARKNKKDIAKIFSEGTLIDEALRAGRREALELHRRLGLPVVVYKDGKTLWVMPDELDKLESSD